MKLIDKYREATVELMTLSRIAGVFIALRQSLRKGALVWALALIPAASALAAAERNLSIADIYDSKSPAVVRVTALTINPYRMDD
ncbi:MAG TPA: hypothetical protein VLC55_02020, partial [Burkholderiales bacterium]|nr:hypothetical protein [Burkholderiales bacterium]